MPTAVRVLILEDQPGDVELMLYELRQADLEPTWRSVETRSDFIASLDEGFEVILADYTLPQFDAMEALQLLQECGLDIPLIIVTGTISEEVAVNCMKQGAADYVLKDRMTRLGQAIIQALQQKQLRDEKREAETALRESEARFRRLAENARDIIYRYRLAPDRGFDYVSPVVTDILGYTPDEHYAGPDLFFQLVHPDDREAFRRLVEEPDSIPQPVVLRCICKNGSIVWTEHRITPVRDESGKVMALEGIARDITERRQFQEQLEISLKEKEILLREVHHRVKNNLQAVISLLSLQADYIEDQQIRQIFQETQDRIKSIALIHQKLYQTHDLVQIDFSEYIYSLAAHLIRSSGVHPDMLALTVEADKLSLDIDMAVPLGIIVNELISNALKHAFPGRHWPGKSDNEIYIELRQDTPKQQLRLTVKDNGVGFPDKDVSEVQSLGLRLVYMLITHLAGTIELERQNGTTFRLTLPAPAPTKAADSETPDTVDELQGAGV